MKKLLSTLVIAVALSAVAFSQQGGGGQRRGGGGVQVSRAGSYYAWASRADVAADIKLTDDQKTKLEDASKARRDALTNAGDDATARREAMQKATETYNTTVAGILTDDQKKRLLGIFVQTFKNQSLQNPDVQAAVGMTDDQKSKIKDLVTQENAANREIQQKVQDGSMERQAATEARTKNGQKLGDDIFALLTDDEKTKFAALAGDAFTPDASLPPLMGGRGGGGGRRGGGAGGAGGAGGNGN